MAIMLLPMLSRTRKGLKETNPKNKILIRIVKKTSIKTFSKFSIGNIKPEKHNFEKHR